MSVDNRLVEIDARGHHIMRTFDTSGHGRTLSVAATPDGKQLVTSHSDGAIVLWDRSSSRVIDYLQHPTGHATYRIVLNSSGNLLATGDAEGTVQLWSMRTRTVITTIKANTGGINRIAFDEQHNRLIVAQQSKDDSPSSPLWYTTIGKNKPEKERVTAVTAQAIVPEPNGSLLVGFADGSTQRLDRDLNTTLEQPHVRHTTNIMAASLSPDDRLVLIASADGTVDILNESSNTVLTRTKALDISAQSSGKQFDGAITSVAVTADGRTAALGTAEGRIELIDLAHADLLRRACDLVYRPPAPADVNGNLDALAALSEACQ